MSLKFKVNPALVNRLNNSGESAYDYARICQKAMVSNLKQIQLNGKTRVLKYIYITDGEEFWNTVVNTMEICFVRTCRILDDTVDCNY